MNKVNTNEEDIVREYQGLVYKIARRFKSPYLEFDDLVQVGFMGLLKSYHRFDKTKNTKFSTFAVYYIMGAIKDELKKVTKEYALKADLLIMQSAFLVIRCDTVSHLRKGK